jgi:riboflavin synthase
MFTGIIKHTGRVGSINASEQSAVLKVALKNGFAGQELGASVAVNGTCLTIVEFTENEATFEIGPETMAKTTLGKLQKGEQVNIEFPLRLIDPLGGHFVQGHVDGVGEIISLTESEGAVHVEIALPEELLEQVILHGSIAIDGVSLTVAKKSKDSITIMLMAYTIENTVFSESKVGDKVNVEIDMLSKYVAEKVAPYH